MIIKHNSPKRVCLDAPAKINLFLEVLHRRQDGFHDINSLFQAVSLYDTLTFELTDQPGIVLTVPGNETLPTGADNLVVRAFELMRRRFGFSQGMAVKLEKRIPVAAGLAGGSSDAAATILACNILHKLKLRSSAMADLGLEIGSDLPFFFSRGQALVTGRGERIEETEFPVDYSLVLVCPQLAISTAASYGSLRMDLTKSKHPFKLPCCRAVVDFIQALGRTGNDFEGTHFRSYPELRKIKDELLQRGAALVRMSGSGPTMFGVYFDRPEFEDLNDEIWGHWRFYTVTPISLQPQAT